LQHGVPIVQAEAQCGTFAKRAQRIALQRMRCGQRISGLWRLQHTYESAVLTLWHAVTAGLVLSRPDAAWRVQTAQPGRAPEHSPQVVCDHHAAHVVGQQRKHVHTKHTLQQQQQQQWE
jgi:hypothetical protein